MAISDRAVKNIKNVFIGIDVHKRSWQVTAISENVELFTGSIPGNWESLEKLLNRYCGCRISAVYEAGYFGYWLYDRLQQWGADCVVTPPSLLPTEYGNRVKTDKRDSRKLAHFLSKGMLKQVWVRSVIIVK
jgi:transposase